MREPRGGAGDGRSVHALASGHTECQPICHTSSQMVRSRQESLGEGTGASPTGSAPGAAGSLLLSLEVCIIIIITNNISDCPDGHAVLRAGGYVPTTFSFSSQQDHRRPEASSAPRMP